MNNSGSPVLIFACEWIPCTAADNAGVGAMQYPVNTRIIGVNCTGRIAPAFIIRAFQRGAAGVLIAGCAEGECHYGNGNGECAKVVEETKLLLSFLGIPGDRLHLELFSDMEGVQFARAVTEFVKRISEVDSAAQEVER